MKPRPIAWWVHLTVGVMLVIAASLARGTAATLTPPLALVYVTWSARRTPGLVLALVAALVVLQAQLASVGPSIRAIVVTWAWLIGYLVIVAVTSVVEAATRPDHRGAARSAGR